MSVYVDPLIACLPNRRWRYTQSCHLFADTVEELHAFAARLGLLHSWFQHRPGRLPHYDLTKGMRARAVAMGATELTDRMEIIRAFARCGDAAAGAAVQKGL